VSLRYYYLKYVVCSDVARNVLVILFTLQPLSHTHYNKIYEMNIIELNKANFYFSIIPLLSIMTQLSSVKSVACNAATVL